MDYRSLAKHARAAKKHAYAPYSRFRVGAALLSRDGRVFTGCNVEDSSLGLTVCAERTALLKAVSEGARRFVAIAVASDENGFTSPCGACRQVLLDIAGDIDVVLTAPRKRSKVLRASELLPFPFGADNLTRKK
jgi:cytidine deaminase